MTRALPTLLLVRCLLLSLPLVLLATPPVAAQGSLLLAGGGSEGADGDPSSWSYEPFVWFVDKTHAGGPNGGNGRILVIDYEDYPECGVANEGYCAYFESLGATEADVQWLEVDCPQNPACSSSNDPAVLQQILSYDGIWFRGGDQSQYVNELKNTLAERAIYKVFAQGGVLGGTSAGAMILSEVASVGDAPSYEATANPYHPALQLETQFLAGPSAVLAGSIVDTHLTQRARLGRLAVFLGRRLVDAGDSILGIGIDPETALTVEPDGVATVRGEGSVSFLQLTPESELELQAGKPPYISSLRLEQLTEGFVYDLVGRSIVGVSPQAEPAGAPPPSVQYGNGGLSGAVAGTASKGEWWADWGSNDLALYEGTLQSKPGTGLLDNAVVVPLLEAQTSLRENRAGGAQWLLQQNPHHGLIVYLDGFNGQEFNRVRVRDDETLRVAKPKNSPEESVVVVDCWGMEWVAHSTWDADGNGLPRQSVALTPCHVHLLNSVLGKQVYDVGAHLPSD